MNAPADIVDPFRRRLLTTAAESQAEGGNIPKLFDESMTNMRQSLLAPAEAEYNRNLETLQNRSVSQGRLEGGLTSFQERQTLENRKLQETGILAGYASNMAMQTNEALNQAGLAEVSGEQQRRAIEMQTGSAERITDTQTGSAEKIATAQYGSAERIAAMQTASAEKIQNSINLLGKERQMLDKDLAAATDATERVRIQALIDINDAEMAQREKELSETSRSNIAKEGIAKAEVTGYTEGVSGVYIQDLAGRLGFTGDTAFEPNTLTPTTEFQAAMDKAGAKFDPRTGLWSTTSTPTLASRLATVEERKAAVVEDTAEIQNSISKDMLDLAKSDQKFSQQATIAQLTGIWEQYGQKQIDEFKAAYDPGGVDPAKYNKDYDFNDDRVVDFKDFVTFAQLVEMGGMPTMEYRKIVEGTRQFDLTRGDQLGQWAESFAETVRQFNLTTDQQWDMMVMTLVNNEKIAEMGYDVNMIANLVDLMSGPGGQLLDDPDGQLILDKIRQGSTLADALQTSKPELYRTVHETERVIANGSLASYTDDVSVRGQFKGARAVFNRPGMANSVKQELLRLFDYNKDGRIDDLDADIYTVFSGGL